MPKDPLLCKVERLKDLPNIYAEELYTQEYEPCSALLSEEDQSYLQSYSTEAFTDLMELEQRHPPTADSYAKH